MRTSITLCSVQEAAAGPFVFHGSLSLGFEKAKAAGFDEVELFIPSSTAISTDDLLAIRDLHEIGISAIGTGAGMVKHGLSLTDPNPAKRELALQFITSMIEFGGRIGAPAILGSMQGKAAGDVSRHQALDWLSDAMCFASEIAWKYDLPFIYEPLNRYESNLINGLGEGAKWLEAEALGNVVLLADLFHMNIEESDIPRALSEASSHIGHIHFADSNRQAMGFGHTDYRSIANTLAEIGYNKCLSAEIFPLPNPEAAAHQTMKVIRELFP